MDCKQAIKIVRNIKRYESKGKLTLPIRRHLMAIDRDFLTDSLVDAVITLEALFSTGDKDQLRLRIAASVAFLLAPDDTKKRKSIFKSTKDLYDTRSKIVHGGNPSFGNIAAANKDALEFSRLCLRELLLGSNRLLASDPQRANMLVISAQ